MVFEFNGILLRAAQHQRSVSLQATRLGDAITELTSQFPQMKRVLLDNSGQVRRAHRMIVNGELVPQPDIDMRLSDADRIEFFTAITGG